MFWVVISVMLAAAVLVVAIPLYRAKQALTMTSICSMVAIAGVAGLLYSQIGTPNPSLVDTDELSIDNMVGSLATKLEQNPNDIEGWKMLGRSYMQLEHFPGAIDAFRKAVELESSQNGQSLADLGEAIVMNDARVSALLEAGQLFESALAIEPNNPKALFFSGMVAFQQGDELRAADLWELLLATSLRPDFAEMLRERVAELRGVPPPVVQPGAAIPDEPVVNVAVSMGDAARAAELPDSTVFVIARDPNQPSPPIAVVRAHSSELPAMVSIGDGDAMIPGRVPSGFISLEIVARISLNGEPIQQPGDWFGRQIVESGGNTTHELIIDQQVP